MFEEQLIPGPGVRGNRQAHDDIEEFPPHRAGGGRHDEDLMAQAIEDSLRAGGANNMSDDEMLRQIIAKSQSEF